MMIMCQTHGLSAGIEVSPDIEAEVTASRHIINPVLIEYEIEGDPVFLFYMSEKFALSHGIKSSRTIALPDELPLWPNEMVPLCEKCFQECLILSE